MRQSINWHFKSVFRLIVFIYFFQINSTTYDDHCPQVTSLENSYLPNNVSREIKIVGKKLPAEVSDQ